MLWPSIKADLKQRMRQNNFTVTLVLMSVLTLLFFPAPDAQYQTLVINDYRGIYNSEWIGICLAMLNALFLPLICFFLIKNAIAMDRQLNTAELIASTPISKTSYVLAKWFGNIVILTIIVLVMILTSIVIQLFYGESYFINLWALVWPQLVFVFPLMVAIAAVAILFESIKWLSGSLGNIIYFFVWVGSIVQSIESVSGIGAVINEIEVDITTRFPAQDGTTNVGVSINEGESVIKTFVWHGLEPTTQHFWAMIPMLGFSALCILIAVFAFDRFSQSSHADITTKKSRLSNTPLVSRLAEVVGTAFKYVTQFTQFTQLLRLELKLLTKGRSVYWVLGLLGLNIAQFFVSKTLLITLILPLSWLWCLLVISQLGMKDKRHGVAEIMAYSRCEKVWHELASYFAAWLVLFLASFVSIALFVVSLEWLLLLQLFIAISFTSALAMFCGSVSGSQRLFEGIYLLVWYLGPIQSALYLDFFGVNSQASWQAGMPYIFLCLSGVLLYVSLYVRRKASRVG